MPGCPKCGDLYIRARLVAIQNYFGTPDGYWFVHEQARPNGNLIKIIRQCYVEYEDLSEIDRYLADRNS